MLASLPIILTEPTTAMVALPATDSVFPLDLSHVRSAYNLVLTAERTAAVGDQKMYARVMGFLMINLYGARSTLGDTPLLKVTKEVVSCNPSTTVDADIRALGLQYCERLLRAFRQAKGPPPAPSNHVSRLSFDTIQDMINDCMDPSPKDYRAARKAVLARDGFRCMLTDTYDHISTKKSQQLLLRQRRAGHGVTYVQCCHILSESTTQNINPDDPAQQQRRDYASSVFAVLKLFGLGSVVATLTAPVGIHHLSNLLSLRTELHTAFDDLELWLEATSEKNTYEVCVAQAAFFKGQPYLKRMVHFEVNPDIASAGKVLPPLPDPKLLAIHAVCAKVAHMSGAAEYFDKFDCDVEDITVLSQDGTSAPLLAGLLTRKLTIQNLLLNPLKVSFNYLTQLTVHGPSNVECLEACAERHASEIMNSKPSPVWK
ncbi:hypothetical protein NLJ89_g10201 [Agrocybe chaxingu]|uniref:HNH nuclease domain-containing protein n=1 Tax=Agrocybe chaxingu TaxID=84603 RepID=A0A9W8JR75_9AGAR|nr:hypothetical protein NLJ89_g10201 [Agrocybe chaxingu]